VSALSHVGIAEAGSGIDRSSGAAYQRDRRRHSPGELLKLQPPGGLATDTSVWLEGRHIGTMSGGNPLGQKITFRAPDSTGQYQLVFKQGGRRVGTKTLKIEHPADGGDPDAGSVGSPGDYTNEAPTNADIDAENYADIVNADTPSGLAWAPDEVESGRSADPDGTEVRLSDGRTATVYPRQESDEAIRDTDTGEPIDSPVGPGGVEAGGGSDSSGGVIGATVAAVVVILAGAAALLGGNN